VAPPNRGSLRTPNCTGAAVQNCGMTHRRGVGQNLPSASCGKMDRFIPSGGFAGANDRFSPRPAMGCGKSALLPKGLAVNRGSLGKSPAESWLDSKQLENLGSRMQLTRKDCSADVRFTNSVTPLCSENSPVCCGCHMKFQRWLFWRSNRTPVPPTARVHGTDAGRPEEPTAKAEDRAVPQW